MRVKKIPYSWILDFEHRLDCGPFTSGGLEAKKAIETASCVKDRLQDLTVNGIDGIYHVGMDKLRWVQSPKYGIPFLRSSDILKADLTTQPYISKDQVEGNPLFLCPQGSTLITRSGTIGRMAYCRSDMATMAMSQDVLKVVPDSNKVRSGYLYAFLSSKYGVPIIISGTFGSIIVHIEAENIADLPVPRLGDAVEQRVHELVEEAARKRSEAASNLRTVLLEVAQQLDAPLPVQLREDEKSLGHPVAISEIEASSRLEGFFHNPVARAVDEWVSNHPAGHWLLGDVATIFDVPPFKHIYVDPEYGVPFYTSGDLFRLERKVKKHLSRKRTKGLEKYILERGWVLLARSGQLGGIIGRPQFSDSSMNQASTSDHVIRIVPKKDKVPAGYLYAYLSMEAVGYPLITRTMTGASIPALWPKYLRDVKVVRAPDEFMQDIDRRVQGAFELRVTATAEEDEARALVEHTIEEVS